MSNNTTQLADFNGYPIEIINHNNQIWLTSEQIGKALGLSNPRRAINKAYNRHADEFTKTMSTVPRLGTVDGKNRELRIFSLRGAHALGFFVQTERAKQFRAWVLDMLENTAPSVDPLPNQQLLVDTQKDLIASLLGRIGFADEQMRHRMADLKEQHVLHVEDLKAQHAHELNTLHGLQREQVAKAVREYRVSYEDNEYNKAWLARAVYVLENNGMCQEEYDEIKGYRALNYSWSKISREFSYRGPSTLSKHFKAFEEALANEMKLAREARLAAEAKIPEQDGE